jgi:cyclophilin family peptidyl-prolyl cis-trans isomerase
MLDALPATPAHKGDTPAAQARLFRRPGAAPQVSEQENDRPRTSAENGRSSLGCCTRVPVSPSSQPRDPHILTATTMVLEKTPALRRSNKMTAMVFSLLLVAFASLSAPAHPPASAVEAVVETDAGSFRFEFSPDKAPKHVEQFLKLAREGYYDGSAFHRVVENGIIQGGDPLLKDPKTPRNLWGSGGLNLLPGEYGDLKHERGTVSTIRIPDKENSDGAQFFVCVYPQPALDGKFSAFGRIVEGMDVVEQISRAPVDDTGLVVEPVRIRRITVEPKKVEPFLTAAANELLRTVTMKTTLGTLRIAMEPEWAPNHVRNFLKLVSTGWYNGTGFHRMVPGFVAQGGMPDTRSGAKGHPADRWVRPLKGEFRQDVKHTRGTVSMARSDDPDSAQTSFFLMLGDAPHLDGQYSAFGRVVGGDDVLAAFEKEEIDGETPRRRLEIIEAVIDPQTPVQ